MSCSFYAAAGLNLRCSLKQHLKPDPVIARHVAKIIICTNTNGENAVLYSGDAAVDEHAAASAEFARCCRDADEVVWRRRRRRR